ACNRPAPLPPPFMGNKIDPSAFAKPSVYITNAFGASMAKLGIVPDDCGKITYNTPIYQDNYQALAQIDYQLSDKPSLFFPDLWTKERQPTLSDVEPNLMLARVAGFSTPAYAYGVGETWVINSTMVNSFRIGFTRINETRPKDDFFNYCTAGVQNFWCGENKAQV